MADDRVLALLAGLLEDPLASGPADPTPQEALLAAADDHGVSPLVGQALHRASNRDAWSMELRNRFWQATCGAAAVEAIRRHELVQTLGALADAGIRPLLMKGTALAYTVYPAPHLRPRLDTDILVRRQEAPVVAGVLRSRGYTRSSQVAGQLVSYQESFEKRAAGGLPHVVDVHWKVSNPQVFADLLSHDELARESVAAPSLGPAARAMGPRHALFMACVHRVAHHQDSERMIWLYDIHLMVRAAGRQTLEGFVALARETRTRAVCHHGLTRAAERFGAPVPDCVTEPLTVHPDEATEPTADFMEGPMHKVDVLRSDLRHLQHRSDRLRLLREHLFPPASYMRRRYDGASQTMLPALYAHRLVSGAWKWLRRAD